MTEERIQNENGPMEPNETEIGVADEEHLITDELQPLIRNETRISTFEESRSKEIKRCN